jgi:hypothetical protein
MRRPPSLSTMDSIRLEKSAHALAIEMGRQSFLCSSASILTSLSTSGFPFAGQIAPVNREPCLHALSTLWQAFTKNSFEVRLDFSLNLGQSSLAYKPMGIEWRGKH